MVVEPLYPPMLIQDYPMVREHFDQKYGGPENVNPKKSRGEYMLRHILRYISTHRKSNCKEIAQDELAKNLTYQRKLKSVEDDVRKFIENNLLAWNLVREDGTEKIYNKEVQLYSLSTFGILYCIHLFTEGDEVNYKLTTIRNLAKTYPDVLPKIFGRFDIFKKILGNNFEYALGLKHIATVYPFGEVMLPSIENILIEFSLEAYQELKKRKFDLAEQLSYIVYTHMFDELELFERNNDKEFMLKTKGPKQITDEKKRILYMEKRMKKHVLDGRRKWIKLINHDPDIKKWYKIFVNGAIRSYSKKVKRLQKMQPMLI